MAAARRSHPFNQKRSSIETAPSAATLAAQIATNQPI